MSDSPSEDDYGKFMKPIAAEHDAVALAIGRVAMAWSALHHDLGDLFAYITNPEARHVAFGAWHSMKSDRGQREALDGAATAALDADSPFLREIRWCLGQLNSLEDGRNNAVHSPYSIRPVDGRFSTVPDATTGSPRAKKLTNRDLKLELESYKRRIFQINRHINSILLAMMTGKPEQLPRTPRLPRPAHTMIDTPHRRGSSDKGPPPPP